MTSVIKQIEYVAKKAELRRLIRLVGHYYKADADECDKMFEDTLKLHDIDTAILSFKTTLNICLKRN